MEDIKQELIKLEFQHKKDIAEAERRFNENFERMQAGFDEIRDIQRQTQLHLNHITKLAGISFDKFANFESRIESAANALLPRAELK